MFVFNSIRLIVCRINVPHNKTINYPVHLLTATYVCSALRECATFFKVSQLSPLSSYVTAIFTFPQWDTQADQKNLQKGTTRLSLFEPLQKHKSPFPQRWNVRSFNVKSADWLEFPPFWSAVFTLLADILQSVGDMRRPRSDRPDTYTMRMRMLILSMLVSNARGSFLLEKTHT